MHFSYTNVMIPDARMIITVNIVMVNMNWSWTVIGVISWIIPPVIRRNPYYTPRAP